MKEVAGGGMAACRVGAKSVRSGRTADGRGSALTNTGEPTTNPSCDSSAFIYSFFRFVVRCLSCDMCVRAFGLSAGGSAGAVTSESSQPVRASLQMGAIPRCLVNRKSDAFGAIV